MSMQYRRRAHRGLVDISWLMEEMAELISVSVSKRGSVRLDCGRNLLSCSLNRAQIRQIVVNSLSMHRRPSPERGHYDRHIARDHGRDLTPNGPTRTSDGSYVRLSISDSRHGLTEDERVRFSIHFLAQIRGPGLGLAVVQGIVRADTVLERFDVVSRRPGHGTTFQIFFPCAGHTEKTAT